LQKDPLAVKVSQLSSTKTQLPYSYYSLPFCRPDAIVDTRSLPPGEPRRFLHELELTGARGPLTVEVTLRFRAFPPYLLRAFIDYEREQERLGKRPGGPLIDTRALERLDIVDVASARVVIP
jgi:hypothetical protein